MKHKEKINVMFNEEKMMALINALDSKGKNLDNEVTDFIMKLYEKTVHAEVKKHIEKRIDDRLP